MATSGRTSTRKAPVYVACRCCVGANFSRGCPSVRHLPWLCCRELQLGMPQCTSLGNAYRGWMMSEVVSVRALNANAPIFIVDVTRGGRFVQPSPLTVSSTPTEVDEIHFLIGGMILLVSPTTEGWPLIILRPEG
ncbi:hypothetical protein CRG98_016462 [Punica granatum]|uniref:Uncharacterized protein n=1 Tax=Punica granatum TaxID=22663 RepID=A0A2I0K4Q7_PUNGR|nr:hypothetical protein CRG98_016462 [Punica granatum]